MVSPLEVSRWGTTFTSLAAVAHGLGVARCIKYADVVAASRNQVPHPIMP